MFLLPMPWDTVKALCQWSLLLNKGRDVIVGNTERVRNQVMLAFWRWIWHSLRPVAARVAGKVFARSFRMRAGLSLISQGIETILASRYSAITRSEFTSVDEGVAIHWDASGIIGDTTIIWIGRFLHKGGYGVASRGIYRALKESGLNVIGIDVQTGKPVDDAGYAYFTTRIESDGTLILRALDKHRRVVCIFQETPPQWSRLSVNGNVHLIGYTLTETEQIPFNWASEMTAVDRLFIPAEWNKDILVRAGIPSSMIEVVPLVADAKLFTPRDKTLPFRASNNFRFLHVASHHLNRRDFGTLIRAYCEAFSPDDSVSLIIKLPGRTREDDIKKFITDPVFPWIDFAKTKTPHILLLPVDLSDEKLVELYASCHAYVSVERGTGWDLPAMEAMLMGLPTLNISWSGNTMFQNPDNSVAISPLERTVFASEELMESIDLYTGHTWAACDIQAVAKGFRRLRDEYEHLCKIALEARCDIANRFSPSKVSELITNYVLALPEYEFHSKRLAEIRLAPQGVNRPRDQDTKKSLYEKLPPAVRGQLDQPLRAGKDVEQWINHRREIYKQFGPVLPPAEERSRLEGLRNKYYGQSIFIIGNGPSLNKIDFDALKDYYCFAANKIYLMFDRVDWRPDFYTSVDWRVTPDCYEEINKLSGMTFFFARRFHGMLREGEDVFWFESFSPGRLLSDKFEPDVTKGLRGAGTTLMAALQLAFFLGFRRMFLIGVDASFVVPDSVLQSGGDRFGTGVQINLESTEDDPNHFDPRYFGKGAKWHDPNLDELKKGFRNAHRAIHVLGGELYNSTIGGELESVPRLPFEEALEYAKKKPKAGT